MVANILNELVEINNDRIASYQEAIQHCDDKSLQPMFKEMIEQSREFITDLNELARQYGIVTDTREVVKGKIYSAWLDIRSVFDGYSREQILKSFEFTELAAQRAYQTALEEESLDDTLRDLVLM